MYYKDEKTRRKLNDETDTKPSLNHILFFEKSKKYVNNKKVLDIGCWTGQYEMLAKDCAKEIIGIDPGKQAIQKAKKIHKENKNIKFQIGDALSLKFRKNCFDVVIFSEVLEHLPKGTEKKALSEINRVLKKKGTLILSTPNNHMASILLDPAYFLIGHRHYSMTYLTKTLPSCGFNIKISVKTGGFAMLICSNIDMIYKYIFRRRFSRPKIVKNIIIREYNRGGFAGNYIVAEKI